jgi:hypothetical protein
MPGVELAGRRLLWPCRDDQAMCTEPEFSTSRDQAVCGDHVAEAVIVQLGAHWMIQRCGKVRLHARHLIESADVCSATG